MSPVAITGIQIASDIWGKDTLLAYFSLTAWGFAISGCALLRRKNGTCVMVLPKIPGRDRFERSIAIVSQDLRIDIVRAAVTAYRAIGGKGAGEPGDPIQTFSHQPEADEARGINAADTHPVEGLTAGLNRWLESAG